MKIKKGYSIIPKNEGYQVLFNDSTLQQPLIITRIGAFLWSLLEDNDLTTAQLLDAVLKEFEISTVLALGEIDTFIKTLKQNHIFEQYKTPSALRKEFFVS